MKMDELIKVLLEMKMDDGLFVFNFDRQAPYIADFILAREKEQISKVVEPLREIIEFTGKRGEYNFSRKYEMAIDKSISIADSILMGEA